MKTKKIFLLTYIALTLTILSGCDKSSSSMVIENPELIKGVIVEGPWTVTIFQSEKASANIKYLDSHNVTAVIKEDGYLYLKVKQKIRPITWTTDNDFTAIINIPNIEFIKGSDACDISINGAFHGEQCKIDLSEESDVKHFEYYGNSIEIDLSGASDCNMRGKANSAKISCSGASDAHMFDFYTDILDIKLSGSSDCEITAEERISGTVSGASTLRYRGNADCSNLKASGSADVIRKN